ncbi:MAG TPA: hypothetical protein VGD54_12210, partial [Steroidobacteraceae bacterium]
SKWVCEQRFSRVTSLRYVLMAAGLSHWLKRRGIPLQNVLSEHAAQYLQHRWRVRRPTTSDAPALKSFMELLLRVGAITDYVRLFLKERFAEGEVRLAKLSASDITGFVQRQALPERLSTVPAPCRSHPAYVHFCGMHTAAAASIRI